MSVAWRHGGVAARGHAAHAGDRDARWRAPSPSLSPDLLERPDRAKGKLHASIFLTSQATSADSWVRGT